MHLWQLLTDIGLLLSSSLLLGAIAIRLGLSPIIGYLLAGVFLGGQGSLNLIKSPHEIESISEIGVSLLLFSLGLEFSWIKVKNLPFKTIKSGVFQILLTPVFFILISKILNIDWKIGIFLGLIFTLSSTATVLRSLTEISELDSQHGRIATAVLLLQDIAVIPFSIIISCLASANPQNSIPIASNPLNTIIIIIILIISSYFFLNKLAGPILSLFTLQNNREMSILLAIVISIGAAWAAHEIGISPSIGAFIAGMLLGSSPFSTQITADIAPLKILFLTLFFGSAGMLADPTWIFSNFPLVILLSLVIIISKILISSVIFSLSGHSLAISVASGMSIAQIGEFAFVLNKLASDSMLIDHELSQVITAITISSLFVTSFLIRFAPSTGLLIQRTVFPTRQKNKEKNNEEQESPNIFIIGYGPAGQEVVNQLQESGIHKFAIIDLSKSSIDTAESEGIKTFIGDVRQLDILEHTGISNAKLVIITIPSYDAVLKTIDNIKYLAPSAHIITRSRYQIYENSFLEAGADESINEERTVGEKLGLAASKHLMSSNKAK